MQCLKRGSKKYQLLVLILLNLIAMPWKIFMCCNKKHDCVYDNDKKIKIFELKKLEIFIVLSLPIISFFHRPYRGIIALIANACLEKRVNNNTGHGALRLSFRNHSNKCRYSEFHFLKSILRKQDLAFFQAVKYSPIWMRYLFF